MPDRINLRQLAYFRAVVEHHSLAAAAEVLRVSQPNLSVAIKQLEEEWGVSLFERAGRGLTVTDTGKVLYERAAELLGGAAALDQEMRAIGRGFTARLRVGFTHVSVGAIADMIARMRDEGAVVSFSLQQAEPQLLETMVELRQLDFAVTHMPVANPALGTEVLAPIAIVLLCRQGDDRWPRESEVALDALTDAPLILPRRQSGTGIYERILEAFAVAGIPCFVVADCNDIAAIYTLVEHGVGLGLVPVHDLHAQHPGFAMHPVTLPSPPEPLALIYPRGRRQLPAVQRAMDLCRKSLRTRDGGRCD